MVVACRYIAICILMFVSCALYGQIYTPFGTLVSDAFFTYNQFTEA